ncbi:hypothetical protein QTP86_001516, partial [Hemibagrus guttatus]
GEGCSPAVEDIRQTTCLGESRAGGSPFPFPQEGASFRWVEDVASRWIAAEDAASRWIAAEDIAPRWIAAEHAARHRVVGGISFLFFFPLEAWRPPPVGRGRRFTMLCSVRDVAWQPGWSTLPALLSSCRVPRDPRSWGIAADCNRRVLRVFPLPSGMNCLFFPSPGASFQRGWRRFGSCALEGGVMSGVAGQFLARPGEGAGGRILEACLSV